MITFYLGMAAILVYYVVKFIKNRRQPMSTRTDIEAAYTRLWAGKHCRLKGSSGPFKLVQEVCCYGPQSGAYVTAQLVYEDGTRQYIQDGGKSKPSKSDVEIRLEGAPG